MDEQHWAALLRSDTAIAAEPPAPSTPRTPDDPDFLSQRGFALALEQWAAFRRGDFPYMWPLDGGWEGWIQAEIAAFLIRNGFHDVAREVRIYRDPKKRVDLMINVSVPDERMVVELKSERTQHIGNRALFMAGIRKDMVKLDPANRLAKYRNDLGIVIALCYSQETISELLQLRHDDWYAFQTICRDTEIAVLAAARRRPAAGGRKDQE